MIRVLVLCLLLVGCSEPDGKTAQGSENWWESRSGEFKRNYIAEDSECGYCDGYAVCGDARKACAESLTAYYKTPVPTRTPFTKWSVK